MITGISLPHAQSRPNSNHHERNDDTCPAVRLGRCAKTTMIRNWAGAANSTEATSVNTIELICMPMRFAPLQVKVQEMGYGVEWSKVKAVARNRPGHWIACLSPLFRCDPSIEGVADMALRVVPEGLAAACAGVEALTARLAAAHAVAAPLITAVAPPAVDPVSLQSAAEFSVRGGLHAALAAQGAEELGRAGIGVGESGTRYASGDAAAASSYVVVSDWR
jgi:hypothetical protein